MEVTKFEHACQVVTKDGARLVLDPGGFTRPVDVTGVVALADAGIAVFFDGYGDHREVGPFTLDFHGVRHQRIHSSVPLVDNTGVLVDGRLFHPGDAYTVPGVPVEVLAAPVGAPWLKVEEMMDWIAAVGPRRAYPVHEATLSDIGFAMHADRQRAALGDGELVVLRPGESLTI